MRCRDWVWFLAVLVLAAVVLAAYGEPVPGRAQGWTAIQLRVTAGPPSMTYCMAPLP